VADNTAVRLPSYSQRLLAELDGIAASYVEILADSEIQYVNPNRPGSRVIFASAANWGWNDGDDKLVIDRMDLLARLRDWAPRFRLLFRHPTPQVAERLDKGIDHLERWLIRDGRWDRSIPGTIDEAREKIRATVSDLGALTNLLPPDNHPVRLVVDTNALIDNPDLAAYAGDLGGKYVAHLMPVVLGEIDELKRSARPEDLRNKARRAERRLKGIRSNGDVRTGVRIEGDVLAVFEHTEPRSDDLPAWLDMDVPDDRFVAATLLLQSAHPGSAIYVATSDINMQTKLSAVGIPFIEPPPYNTSVEA
jgi:rRNA-processing protein FCF1